MTGVKTPKEILSELGPEGPWKLRPNEIARSYKFPSFKQSIEFVNRIAEHSEQVDHHPNIMIRYRTVNLNLTTHSRQGVTEKDIAWAREADRIFSEMYTERGHNTSISGT